MVPHCRPPSARALSASAGNYRRRNSGAPARHSQAPARMASMEEALLDCDDVAALDPLDENAVVSFIGARYRKAALSKTAWPGLPGEKRPVASTFASHAHLPVAAASPPHDSGEGAGL